MIEVRIYDPGLEFQGIIENFQSLLWTRRYFAAGEFSMVCPITPNNQTLLQLGNIVWKRGSTYEAGVIESITMSQTGGSNAMTVTGRFLESYMDRRLIRPTYDFDEEKVEVCMRSILNNAVALPLVQLGTLKGYDEEVSFQATYKNLLAYEEKLARYSNIGYRFIPDFVSKTITFDCYKGIDRSVSQSDRNRVIFSDDYNNLSEATYTLNATAQKTVCYVGGKGEGSSRVYVVAGDNTLTGLERREVFLSATDVSDENLTNAKYRAALRQRGNNELKENALSETFECRTTSTGNFEYKVHYDLGDIVTVRKPKWGVSVDLRITEVMEAYENGALTIIPTLGDPLPEKIDWEDKS